MPEGISSRLRLVDGDDGEGFWSTATDVLPKYAGGVRCAVGGVVFFKWDAAWNHDIVKLHSQAHFEACDLTSAVSLASPAAGGMQSFSYVCETPGEVVYLACSVADHCVQGQKVMLTTSDQVHVHPAPGGVHMASLAMVMRMLNYPSMDTGFGSEAQANTTLDLIWCLEAHCSPSGGSALDFHPDATEASCVADVHNLAGYVTRSRPLPNYPLALAYYDEALAQVATHCPTLEYKTELFLQTANATAAVAAALALCEACGPASDVVAQAQAAFGATPIAPFPTAACDAFAPPPSPPPPSAPPSLSPSPPPAGESAAEATGGSSSKGVDVGLVAGLCVGGAAAALLVVGACYYMRSKNSASTAPAYKGSSTTSSVPNVPRTPAAHSMA